MQRSLQQRVWITAGLSLLAFVVFIGLGVDRAYRETLYTGLQQQLEARLYALMASVDFRQQELLVELPDPALSSPASALCAWIADAGQRRWQSASCLGKTLPALPVLPAGTPGFRALEQGPDRRWVQWLAVNWELEDGQTLPLTFAVAHDEAPVHDRLHAFRQRLLGGLLLAGVVLLLMQWLSLRWLLRPVRQLEWEVHAVEQGRQERVQGQYPRELNTLAQALNALIHTGQAQMQRYRNALSDLAHSLKTPLQVLRASLDDVADADLRQRLADPLERMDTLMRWQLQRASTAGRRTLRGRVALQPVLQALVQAMNKLFNRRGVRVELHMPEAFWLQADEGDLQELLGNLMENACKWAKSRVRVEAVQQPGKACIRVDDDGPGFPPTLRENLLQRGVRADEQVEGQGIGLSVVVEIVRAYGGQIRLLDAPLGGARVEVELPQT